jgi:hypothetical protein
MPAQITAASTSAPFTNTNYNALLPRAVDFAELLMQQDPELNLTLTRATLTSTCTISARAVPKATGLIYVDTFNIITPAGYVPDQLGSARTPLQLVNPGFINNAFSPATGGSVSSPMLPRYVAWLDDSSFALGPAPDQPYVLEQGGTTRITPLSASNPTTPITLNFFPHFVAATMIYVSGAFQKNFGAQASTPQQAVSWRDVYSALKRGAGFEEAKKKFSSPPAPNPPSS